MSQISILFLTFFSDNKYLFFNKNHKGTSVQSRMFGFIINESRDSGQNLKQRDRVAENSGALRILNVSDQCHGFSTATIASFGSLYVPSL